MLSMVSSELNNTPAVCRRSYIHPEVIERYLDGNLRRDWAAASARGSRLLSPEERRLLHLLEAYSGATS
jgi:DNA topoisomerase-1